MQLNVNAEELRPVVEMVVRLTIEAMERERTTKAEQLCYTEREAAELLGLHQHQLAEERKRGRIAASRIVCNRLRYLKADLVGYLMRKREQNPTH